MKIFFLSSCKTFSFMKVAGTRRAIRAGAGRVGIERSTKRVGSGLRLSLCEQFNVDPVHVKVT